MQNDKSKFKDEFKRRIYIGANIIEARAASSGKAEKDRTNKLQKETNEIASIEASSILTLKGKR